MMAVLITDSWSVNSPLNLFRHEVFLRSNVSSMTGLNFLMRMATSCLVSTLVGLVTQTSLVLMTSWMMGSGVWSSLRSSLQFLESQFYRNSTFLVSVTFFSISSWYLWYNFQYCSSIWSSASPSFSSGTSSSACSCWQCSCWQYLVSLFMMGISLQMWWGMKVLRMLWQSGWTRGTGWVLWTGSWDGWGPLELWWPLETRKREGGGGTNFKLLTGCWNVQGYSGREFLTPKELKYCVLLSQSAVSGGLLILALAGTFNPVCRWTVSFLVSVMMGVTLVCAWCRLASSISRLVSTPRLTYCPFWVIFKDYIRISVHE